MADIKQVGPGGAPQPPKKKRDVEAEAFEKMMKRVREVDPEEQRKRKRQQEAEEEKKAAQAAGGPAPVPKEELGKAVPEDTFKITLGETAPGGMKGRLGAAAPAAPTGEEEAAAAPSEAPADYPETPFDYTSGWTQTLDVTPSPAEAPPSKAKAKKEAEKAKPVEPIPKIAAPKPPVKKAAPAPVKKAIIPPPLAKPQVKAPIPTKPKAPAITPPSLPKEVKKKEPEQAPQVEGIVPPPLPAGAWEAATQAAKEEERIKKVEAPQEEGGMPTPLDTMLASIPTLPPEATAPYLRLPPQIMEIFERMAGVMTVMTSSGITQTSIVLDAPQFANSVFFGAEIIISEFSTAPKAFNIELLANPQGVNLANTHIEELVAAFQAGQYNFRVNRIDTALLPVPAAKRRRVEKPKGRSST